MQVQAFRLPDSGILYQFFLLEGRYMGPIFRIWHGRTSTEKADENAAYAVETGVPGIRATPGNLGVLVLRSDGKEVCHFWVISAWKDMQSIKAFAGDEPEKPRYYPRDAELLLELEPRVIHCEAVWAYLALAPEDPITTV